MELLPYNWEWKGISKIYVNLTRSLGDVHHLAWRATHPKWAVYSNADHARYAEWTPEECNSRYQCFLLEPSPELQTPNSFCVRGRLGFCGDHGVFLSQPALQRCCKQVGA